jgi:CHAT domain-containing protein
MERAALVMNDGTSTASLMSAADVYHASSRERILDNSLIVLASCSGGRAFAGGWDSERELMGLSVAHLHAGCGAVVAASRPLLDSPTLEILKSFLIRLVSGKDALSSLTEAQLEMAQSKTRYAHAHFWGYLGLMGVPSWELENLKGKEN